MDELRANATHLNEYRDACMMAFTETWFDHSVSDRGSFVDGFGCPTRLDRDKKATGKEKGGGVCLYVNERWCKNVIVREQLCTPDIELLSVSLRPLYLPREFPQLFVTVVYIHPKANVDRAAQQQGCFDCTDWDVFRNSCSSLDELTDVVTSYVSFCVDTVIPVKKCKVFPNNKPWVSMQLKHVLNEKKRVYFRGDLAERKEIQRTVRAEIRKARESYKHKIEMKFQTGDMRAVWDGIRIMSDMQQNGQHSNRLSPLGVKMTGYLQKI